MGLEWQQEQKRLPAGLCGCYLFGMQRKMLPFADLKISYILIGLNVLVQVFMWLLPGLNMILGINTVTFFAHRFWWTPLTYMFAHGGMTHLLVNMLGLFFFGPPLEKRIGSWEFLVYYLATGVLAGFFSLGLYFFMGAGQVVLIGASGAIYAVMLAFATWYPRAKVYIMGIIPVRAPVMILIFAGLSVFQQVVGVGRNVAHLTHLAGLVFGFLYILIRFGVNPIRIFIESRYNSYWE
jgi:membrane associated rhomboid family serine protease